jgi:hypothetical protein
VRLWNRRLAARQADTKARVLLAILLPCSAHLFSGNAFAQTPENEPAAVIELGGSGSWDTRDASSSFGPTVAVEVTPIRNWLELEAGVTAAFAHQSTEWSTDLLFKKPWTLSEKVEFMVGAGPAWLHSRTNGIGTNSVAGEAVLDFMFWPGRKRRFGWYFEPGYEYDFGRGHEKSAGLSAGLLIAIGR